MNSQYITSQFSNTFHDILLKYISYAFQFEVQIHTSMHVILWYLNYGNCHILFGIGAFSQTESLALGLLTCEFLKKDTKVFKGQSANFKV